MQAMAECVEKYDEILAACSAYSSSHEFKLAIHFLLFMANME